MAILNPCCCISLQRGSKIVAIVDIILACIPLLVFLTSFVPGAYGDQAREFTDFNTGIWTIFVVFLTADVGLSVLLFCAASERCTKNLKRWFYVRLVTAGGMVLLIIVSSCFHVSFGFIAYDLAYTLYRLYTLWLIYLYVGELVHEETFYTRKTQPHPNFSVSVISSSKNPYSGSYTNGAYQY